MKESEIASEIEFAESILSFYLQDGEWHSCEEVRQKLTGHKIRKSVLKQARKGLQIETRNNGDGTWDWRLK